MKFCFSHCVHGRDLFKTFNFADRVGLKKKIFNGIYKADTSSEFCASVLSYCFKLIFEDIIENNCTFELPLVAKRHAEIYIQPIVGDELKNGLKAGKWRNLYEILILQHMIWLWLLIKRVNAKQKRFLLHLKWEKNYMII